MVEFILDTFVAGIIFRLLLGAIVAYLMAKTFVYIANQYRDQTSQNNEDWRN